MTANNDYVDNNNDNLNFFLLKATQKKIYIKLLKSHAYSCNTFFNLTIYQRKKEKKKDLSIVN